MNNNSYRLIISNRPIFEFLKMILNIPPGNKKGWKTLQLILKSSKKFKKAYLQGFFDADGIAKTNGTLGYCQAIIEPLDKIQHMLDDLGIKYNPITKHKIYYMYIKKESRSKFIKEIGSLNKQKFEKF